jgi:hypothetical protein
MSYVRLCSVCDKHVLSDRYADWPLCEIHKDHNQPICPKCKKRLNNASYLSMGISMKCFDCDYILTN